MAGVAGLIVAIGITADSFIVYFERIRDELRDGKGLESAVEAGWKRALRTILASDGINFLAASILFILAEYSFLRAGDAARAGSGGGGAPELRSHPDAGDVSQSRTNCLS